jgi:hypothetical protein
VRAQGGGTSGFVLDEAELSAARPRYEVTVLADESGHIEREEAELASLGEFERKKRVEKTLKMWRTEEELADTSDISYAARERAPAHIRIGLAGRGWSGGEQQQTLGVAAGTVSLAAAGTLCSAPAGAEEQEGEGQHAEEEAAAAGAEALAALSVGDVVGVTALFDPATSEYSGYVAFDVNGGAPVRVRHPHQHQRGGATGAGAGAGPQLCPAVQLGRGDRLELRTPGAEEQEQEDRAGLSEHGDGAVAAAGLLGRQAEEAGPAFACPSAGAEVLGERLQPRQLHVCPDQLEWLQTVRGGGWHDACLTDTDCWGCTGAVLDALPS